MVARTQAASLQRDLSGDQLQDRFTLEPVSTSEDRTSPDRPPVKVTFCAYDKPDNIGGPVSWIRRLFPLLRDRGIEARCLFIMHWGDTGPAISPLRSEGFECPSTHLDRTEDRVRWILEDLRDNPPDVFIPNLVAAGYFAARWARAAGIPTVGVLHSDDDFYRALQAEFVFGNATERIDAIVCVSRQIEQDVLAVKPAGTLVSRIPYGVPAAPVSSPRRPGRPGRPATELRIAYSGRLADEQKRITDVVRALGRALREVPGTRATLYGDGPQRQKVEMLISEELDGLEVSLAGLIDSEKMQEAMLNEDVIVLLSDFEGLPISLLEAMACGCVPVCLSGRSGIPELVAHEETGLLVDDRGDAFVDAIRRLRDDPALLDRLSNGATARAEDFSSDRSADAWAELLTGQAKNAKPRSRLDIPARLPLPPVHPHLASADRRRQKVAFGTMIYGAARRTLGGWKRRMRG